MTFLEKSDCLCLRYGDKKNNFQADADAAIVVTGHFFSSCSLYQRFLVTPDAIKRTQSERKKRVFTHRRRTKLFPSFRRKKILRQYAKSSGRYFGVFVVTEKVFALVLIRPSL